MLVENAPNLTVNVHHFESSKARFTVFNLSFISGKRFKYFPDFGQKIEIREKKMKFSIFVVVVTSLLYCSTCSASTVHKSDGSTPPMASVQSPSAVSSGPAAPITTNEATGNDQPNLDAIMAMCNETFRTSMGLYSIVNRFRFAFVSFKLSYLRM